jgi:hypothetical protein
LKKIKILIIVILIFTIGVALNLLNDTKGQAMSKTSIQMDNKVRKNDVPTLMTGVVVVDGNEYKMIRGGYRWEWKEGFVNRVRLTDAASPNQIAKDLKAITLEANQKINIEIEENPQLSVYL